MTCVKIVFKASDGSVRKLDVSTMCNVSGLIWLAESLKCPGFGTDDGYICETKDKPVHEVEISLDKKTWVSLVDKEQDTRLSQIFDLKDGDEVFCRVGEVYVCIFKDVDYYNRFVDYGDNFDELTKDIYKRVILPLKPAYQKQMVSKGKKRQVLNFKALVEKPDGSLAEAKIAEFSKTTWNVFHLFCSTKP